MRTIPAPERRRPNSPRYSALSALVKLEPHVEAARVLGAVFIGAIDLDRVATCAAHPRPPVACATNICSYRQPSNWLVRRKGTQERLWQEPNGQLDRSGLSTPTTTGIGARSIRTQGQTHVGTYPRSALLIASAARRRASRPTGSISASTSRSKVASGFARRPGLPVPSDGHA
jgi:hypothetical protein